jgi:hypothetical protein
MLGANAGQALDFSFQEESERQVKSQKAKVKGQKLRNALARGFLTGSQSKGSATSMDRSTFAF